MPPRAHNPAALLMQLAAVFREHGFEGASMARISAATGLGKGSLYNAFPGGKDEMAVKVLAMIDDWFETEVFAPLRTPETPAVPAVRAMLDACQGYFWSGGRVCLLGAFALSDTRDRFATAISGYFRRWHDALTAALVRLPLPDDQAAALSEEILSRIQGGLVLARSLNDPACFVRELDRIRARLARL
ncbi:TetR/AcrR family transcriptional regulator [Novispirillum itersonii]|uniref:TetR/AcrR family transcriptional regulator n=1 Tax=Novispirillum itersonii TaxID=189 RepID=UPI00035DAA42|nr:TetR/AcrR family transcriptional regulator [Novispirillum itersonii]